MPTKINTVFEGNVEKVPIACACYWVSTNYSNKNLIWRNEFDGYFFCGTYWNNKQGNGKNGGKNIFIGYGALQDEYETLSIEANVMKLRIQGTETGNAWYLTLVPKS